LDEFFKNLEELFSTVSRVPDRQLNLKLLHLKKNKFFSTGKNSFT
jgi:hypothetical protein